jgi:predicted metal-dependent phosphoesterase TrpH
LTVADQPTNMRYDLHAHTAEYSPCSVIAADELCRLATVLGIDGIALTEHDLWRPHDELVSLRARHPGLIIFEGMERSCREGHFLVFLPEHEGNRSTLPPGTVHALSPWTHARGGLLIWAHPFRFEGPRLPSWLNEVSIDGIEVASSNMNLRSAELAEKTARDYGLSVFTNSDAHAAEPLGRYGNDYAERLQTVDQLIRYVKKGVL